LKYEDFVESGKGSVKWDKCGGDREI